VPDRTRHEAAARSAAELSATLDASRAAGFEWIPTLVFYAVIHPAEGQLAEQAVHPEGHAGRAAAIEREWGEDAAYLFNLLRDLSEQWRYSARPPSDADLGAAKQWASQFLDAIGLGWPVVGFLES
jgi:hypothetical protein